MTDIDQERRARAESLRVTQLVLNVEVDPWDPPFVAHWVHTGERLPDPSISTSRDGATPDSARWTPGDAE